MILCSCGTHRKYIGDQAMGNARGIISRKTEKEEMGKREGGCSPTSGDQHG
jgi:hypothetical protein